MLFSNLFVKNVVQDLTSAGLDWAREKWKFGVGSKFIRQGEKNAVKYLQIAGRARKLMRRLGMWAAGYDCAIVLIGHLNKKEGSKGLYRSLGSIDVVAAARSVLQVERDTENPDIRIVHQIKNSLGIRKRIPVWVRGFRKSSRPGGYFIPQECVY